MEGDPETVLRRTSVWVELHGYVSREVGTRFKDIGAAVKVMAFFCFVHIFKNNNQYVIKNRLYTLSNHKPTWYDVHRRWVDALL